MTIKVTIPSDEFGDWTSWNERWANMSFRNHLLSKPEIVSFEYVNGGIELEFKSEQHYHWFLLQQ